MANVLVEKSTMTKIAKAIRNKNGETTKYKPSEMPDAIADIQGGITPTGTKYIFSNGTYDVTEYADAEVSVVPIGNINIVSNGEYDVKDYATANVTVSGPSPTGTKEITANGTHNVVGYASANVAVPNSYSAGDEGKVVSNGALVSQSSDSVTQNGTVDTTLINSLTVNVDAFDFNGVAKVGFTLNGSTLNKKDSVFDFGSINVEWNSKSIKSTESNASLTIKCGELSFTQAAFTHYNVQSTVRTVTLNCSNNPGAGAEMTRDTKITRFLGKPFTCSNFGTGNSKCFNSTNIVEFYLVPNCVSVGNGGIKTGELINASIVSVANGLKEGLATTQTLTISNAATKAKCSNIMGTVSEVTENENTYHLFTENESGTVSLSSFITTTKGWTLA